MKTIKGKGSKISRQPVAARGHGPGAVLPNGGSASPGFPGEPSAPSAPASGYVLKKAGQVAQVTGGKTARRTRTRRAPVVMPANIVRAWFTVPAVRDEIELQRRLVIVQAVAAMKKLGISQNRAARELGIAGSKLSMWLSAFASQGKEGLRPKPWHGGKGRHNAFLEIRIR